MTSSTKNPFSSIKRPPQSRSDFESWCMRTFSASVFPLPVAPEMYQPRQKSFRVHLRFPKTKAVFSAAFGSREHRKNAIPQPSPTPSEINNGINESNHSPIRTFEYK